MECPKNAGNPLTTRSDLPRLYRGLHLVLHILSGTLYFVHHILCLLRDAVVFLASLPHQNAGDLRDADAAQEEVYGRKS